MEVMRLSRSGRRSFGSLRSNGNMNCFVLRLGFARVTPLYLQYLQGPRL